MLVHSVEAALDKFLLNDVVCGACELYGIALMYF